MVSIDSSAGRKFLLIAPLILLVALTLAVDYVELGPGGDQAEPNSEQAKALNHCRTISQPGEYVLTDDFGGATGLASSCLVINSSDVTINGSGHTLKGRGVTDTTGILVTNESGLSNVTIHSVRVEQWNRAIHLRNASDVTIRNASAVRSSTGITVWNGSRVTVKNTWVARNLFGVVADNRSQQVNLTKARYHKNFAANSTRGTGEV
ncbi:copper-binding protein [Haladaptatus sp. DFWS20]|uniref:copper-binding protein n=1 Tax=Haladaptatus sp. DFWS20 TaxID=3403467 RepID=UPI003EC13C75